MFSPEWMGDLFTFATTTHATITKWLMWSAVLWILIRKLEHFHVMACTMCRLWLTLFTFLVAFVWWPTPSVVDLLVIIQCSVYMMYLLTCENTFVYVPDDWTMAEVNKILEYQRHDRLRQQ